ncbi:hypothetical protein [Salinisphaera sp. G21_0]|uniref:hypothetical protein n=1 Tax=Salinisphaera sp. G21_0 TaxID=2821094 RepID=UPI001ADCF15A|nr:hypothetical protein [Salinisphaera sp. G21_0]MBO9481716.1 hypothetical protein [Salinisphaera sp. G21_0]
METTIRNASYTSIPLQSINEDPKTSSENTGGSFRTSNGKSWGVVIGLGVAVIGGTTLGLLGGFGLLNGAETKSTPTQSLGNTTSPGPENTQGFDVHRGRNITVSNSIPPSTQTFITKSITTTPKIDVRTPHASWLSASTMGLTSTASQGTPTPTAPGNAARQFAASTTNTPIIEASTPQSTISPTSTASQGTPTSTAPGNAARQFAASTTNTPIIETSTPQSTISPTSTASQGTPTPTAPGNAARQFTASKTNTPIIETSTPQSTISPTSTAPRNGTI